MKNIIDNIKFGSISNKFGKTLAGFELAKETATDNEKRTGNKTIVVRILDNADMYNGHRREFYSFDVVEIIGE